MKKVFIVVIVLLVVVFDIIIIKNIYDKNNNEVVKDNYIAVFKGETSNKVFKTYLYKNKKGKKKYKYINTEGYLSGYDNSIWEEKVTKKKDIKKLNEIFKVAEKNNAYDQAHFNNDDTVYSIEDFKKLLMKDIK